MNPFLNQYFASSDGNISFHTVSPAQQQAIFQHPWHVLICQMSHSKSHYSPPNNTILGDTVSHKHIIRISFTLHVNHMITMVTRRLCLLLHLSFKSDLLLLSIFHSRGSSILAIAVTNTSKPFMFSEHQWTPGRTRRVWHGNTPPEFESGTLASAETEHV